MFHVISSNLRSVPSSELFFFAVLSSWIVNGPDGAIEDTSGDEAREILETLFSEISSCCLLPTMPGERDSVYRNLHAAGNPWHAPLQGVQGRTADRCRPAGNAWRRREMSRSRSRRRSDY